MPKACRRRSGDFPRHRAARCSQTRRLGGRTRKRRQYRGRRETGEAAARDVLRGAGACSCGTSPCSQPRRRPSRWERGCPTAATKRSRGFLVTSRPAATSLLEEGSTATGSAREPHGSRRRAKQSIAVKSWRGPCFATLGAGGHQTWSSACGRKPAVSNAKGSNRDRCGPCGDAEGGQ